MLWTPAHDCGREALCERRCRMKPVSRRTALKSGGALVVSFAIAPSDALGQAVATLVGNPSKDVDGWLSIAADGTITAYTGKCEMGQGLYTAQTQLVAEELGVPLDRVK